MKLQNRVKEIRTKRRMNQSQLAQAAGTAQQTISDIETGRRTPSIYTALRLAAALEVRVEKIFYLEE